MFEEIPITHDPKGTKVALLAGGTSGERDISLNSAKGAMGALTEAGYQVTQLDPANKDDLKTLIDSDFDVAFLALHGKGGEDGSMQGFLQTIGIPYTCSDVWGSAVSIDKTRAKVFYEKDGIPTPKSTVVKREDLSDGGRGLFDDASPIGEKSAQAPAIRKELHDMATVITAELGQKVAVKAATEGSSIGVFIVEGADAVADALEEALRIDDKVLLEQYIAGREFTCVVGGAGERAQALPVIEIVPKNDFYDIESKYAPGGCEHICPAPITEGQTEAIQKYAVMAQKALGAGGFARTDFLLDDKGEPWALETNTIPGMTATSLLPDAAEVAGISFPQLVTLMVQMAFDAAN